MPCLILQEISPIVPAIVKQTIDRRSLPIMNFRMIAWILFSATGLSGQVLTWHNDSGRTGQNLQETILTPANVNSATFGRLGTLTVDGKVDAQPLYVPGVNIPNQGVHNVLYVATEHGSLYAFDADSFQQLLKVTLLGANETSASVSCTQVTPEIGITGTPAIDLQAGPHGMIFAVSQSQDASHNFHHRLHALDLPTLTEQLGGPVNITATYPGSGAENTFNPTEHVARPALLILNGVVYTSWGSHCDGGNYAGWILSYSETTLAQVGVLNVVPNGSDGGIWSAGSGPAADASGNIYALIGNGTFDATLNASGFPINGDYGNAMIKVSTSGALSVVDYFTMYNSVSESSVDTDFGSAGLMLLPPLDNGQGANVSLAVGAGKDHNIYIVDQTNLGKFNSSIDTIYQQLSGALPGGTWSSPAWFNGSLYYAGSGDYLRQFTFAGGTFSLTTKSSVQFAFPGATPSISANGASNGIVWAIQNLNPAVLHAYDSSHFPNELYNTNQAANSRDHFGAGNKYIVPTIANGKVYVGTTTGVGVFGLLAPTMYSLTTSVSPSGGGTVTPASGTSYTAGTVVNLQAIPNGGYSFVNWTGSVANANAPSTTVTMSSAQSVTANFQTATGSTGAEPASTGPGAGSGFTQSFTFTFQDPLGYADLGVVDVLINNSLDGVGACYFALTPASATSGYLYLVDDAGDGGYVSGTPMLLPSSNSLENSQCTINGTGSSVSASGNTLTLTVAVTFTSGFAGNKIFYTAARSTTQNSGWQALGTWNVPGSVPAGPAVGGVSPGRSTTMGQTFTFTFTDTNGYADLNVLDILTNSFLDGISACYVAYVPTGATTGYLYLVDDAGDGGYVSGSPMLLSSGGTLQNSQCSINTAASSASASGNTLNLNLAIAFKAGFAGNQIFYLAARNSGTGNSGWQAAGSVTVP
jgi:hypothetical protein